MKVNKRVRIGVYDVPSLDPGEVAPRILFMYLLFCEIFSLSKLHVSKSKPMRVVAALSLLGQR